MFTRSVAGVGDAAGCNDGGRRRCIRHSGLAHYESHRPAERFKAQAANDFTVFGVQATASLAAGAVMYRTSWEMVNTLALPFLVVMLAALLLLHRYRSGTAQVVTHPV